MPAWSRGDLGGAPDELLALAGGEGLVALPAATGVLAPLAALEERVVAVFVRAHGGADADAGALRFRQDDVVVEAHVQGELELGPMLVGLPRQVSVGGLVAHELVAVGGHLVLPGLALFPQLRFVALAGGGLGLGVVVAVVVPPLEVLELGVPRFGLEVGLDDEDLRELRFRPVQDGAHHHFGRDGLCGELVQLVPERLAVAAQGDAALVELLTLAVVLVACLEEATLALAALHDLAGHGGLLGVGQLVVLDLDVLLVGRDGLVELGVVVVDLGRGGRDLGVRGLVVLRRPDERRGLEGHDHHAPGGVAEREDGLTGLVLGEVEVGVVLVAVVDVGRGGREVVDVDPVLRGDPLGRLVEVLGRVVVRGEAVRVTDDVAALGEVEVADVVGLEEEHGVLLWGGGREALGGDW